MNISPKFKNNKQVQQQSEEYEPMELIDLLTDIQKIEIVSSSQQANKTDRNSLILEEDEVVTYLEYTAKEISNKIQVDFTQIIKLIKQGDLLIDKYTQNKHITWKLYTFYKLNIGLVYYKYGFLEETIKYLSLIIQYLLKCKKQYKVTQDRIILQKLLIQSYLQCSIIHSEMGLHDQALLQSKNAFKYSISLILITIKLLNTTKNNDETIFIFVEFIKNISTLPDIKHKQLNKIFSILHIHRNTNNIDLSILFQKLSTQQIQQANILSFLQMKFLNIYELIPIKFIQPNCLLENIAILVVSLYSISTESRFKESPVNNNTMTTSENYLTRSLELSYLFLHHEMPIVPQIISVYNRFHSMTKEVIYEDKENSHDDYSVIVLKPLKGQSKGQFFVPLIRKQRHRSEHSKTDIEPSRKSRSIKERSYHIRKPIQINETNRPLQTIDQIERRTKSAEKKIQRQSPQSIQLQQIYQTVQKPKLFQNMGAKFFKTQNNTITIEPNKTQFTDKIPTQPHSQLQQNFFLTKKSPTMKRQQQYPFTYLFNVFRVIPYRQKLTEQINTIKLLSQKYK